MKFTDIKPRYIYNVIFDPVRYCEFDRKHLALVLKKNNDKQTAIVMPLTSEPNGNGVNKLKVGIINSLPSSLRSNDTYASFNQIRTVNASRFISLKEGANVIESKIDDALFLKLLDLGTSDLMFDLTYDEKIYLCKLNYEKTCVSKAIFLAYNILSLDKEISNLSQGDKEDPLISNKKNEIERIKLDIKGTLSNVEYKYALNENHIKNSIDKILADILD